MLFRSAVSSQRDFQGCTCKVSVCDNDKDVQPCLLKDSFFKEHCVFMDVRQLHCERCEPVGLSFRFMCVQYCIGLYWKCCGVRWCKGLYKFCLQDILVSLCCTRTVYCSNFGSPLQSLQALDFVDARTRKDLDTATNTREIHTILNKPSTIWMNRARCLRHPLKEHGCDLPMGMDLDLLLMITVLYCTVTNVCLYFCSACKMLCCYCSVL